ncbi:MAG: glutathione S-transferase [Rhodobacterales bacterium]|nr:MAG: glutathione S-transferase [Rhodobacterales bacterium]
MIRVHHLNRSRSHRILWLLEELGQPYEVIRYERDATTNLAPPELLNIHPLGKAPMIELDGRLVVESGAITELLCDRFAPGMIPARNTDAYITHLELMHFAEGSAMTPLLLALYVRTLGEAGKPLGPRIKQQVHSHFAFMDQILRPSGHFVLDDLSAVDIMLSFPAEIAVKQGHGDRYPKLARFVAEIRARPAYVAALKAGGPD